MRWASAIGLAPFVLISVGIGCSDANSGAAGAGGPSDAGRSDASSTGDGSTSNGGDGATPDGGPEVPGLPAVDYVGRFDRRDADGPRVGWGGARVVYRFQGTGLTVKLTEDDTGTPADPSSYDVMIDGVVQTSPLSPANGSADHVVASNLGAGVHVVELWRRTESHVGITQFRGFEISGGGELLAPPKRPSRRIEFLGDSASNGYGVECADANGNFSGATQNERKSYPALIAKAVSAEHHNLSFGGKGIMRNYDAADNDMFTSIYLRALAEDAASTWNFADWVPDLVWIGLAGNDFDLGQPPRAAPDLATFKAKYHDLVTLVRSKNANAQILCTVPASLTDDYPVGFDAYTNVTTILKAVVEERHGAPYDDSKVHYYELPRADSSGANGAPDLTACEFHSNAAFHQTIATAGAARVKTIMGW